MRLETPPAPDRRSMLEILRGNKLSWNKFVFEENTEEKIRLDKVERP